MPFRLASLAPVVVWLVLGAGAAGPPPPERVLVAVTDPGRTGAIVWARADREGPVQIELRADDGGAVAGLAAVARPAADLIVQAAVTGLAPARRYTYQVRTTREAVTGEFMTAPPADQPVPATLLWSGDLGARGFCPGETDYPILRAMAARRAALLLLVGDTVYADHPCGGFVASTVAGFRAKHRAVRAHAAVQGLLRRMAVAAVWDDHEVRGNFAGAHEPLMPAGRAAFLDYWPVATPGDDPTRLYRALRWGRLLEIFVLDTRQYRSANCRPDGPGKTMLGAEQRRWLVEQVTASDAVWKAVVSSVPLSLPKSWPCGDSWAPRRLPFYRTGFAAERDAVLAALRRRGVRNLVVLAADVHFAAVMEHRPADDFVVRELVAGPLAAGAKAPWDPAPGLRSRVLWSGGGQPTFGELGVDTGGLTVRIRDARGGVLHEARFDPA